LGFFIEPRVGSDNATDRSGFFSFPSDIASFLYCFASEEGVQVNPKTPTHVDIPISDLFCWPKWFAQLKIDRSKVILKDARPTKILSAIVILYELD